jgi:hypothetical protein
MSDLEKLRKILALLEEADQLLFETHDPVLCTHDRQWCNVRDGLADVTQRVEERLQQIEQAKLECLINTYPQTTTSDKSIFVHPNGSTGGN